MLCKDPSFYGKDHGTESGKQFKKAYLDDLLGQSVRESDVDVVSINEHSGKYNSL